MQKGKQILESCQRIKNALKYKGDSDTKYKRYLGTVCIDLERGLKELEIRGKVETLVLLRSARILRIVLGRLYVTQTPVKNLQLLWKNLKKHFNNHNCYKVLIEVVVVVVVVWCHQKPLDKCKLKTCFP